jgi:GT2 family glycosyltransferase
MKKVSVVIINYRTRDILRDCIKNLEGKYPDMELIVIDNSSPDGSADMVRSEFPKEKFPWITLIEAPNNGLAASSNIGLEHAKGDYILFMGSDAFPEKGTIEGMVDYMEKFNDIGIATAKLVQRDYELDMDAHRGFPTPWAAITHFTKLNAIFPKSKLFNRYFMGYENFEAPHEIDLCISHFMLIRKEVFDKVGKWDADYFLYGEDVDFCWRTKQAGYKIMYLPMWTSVHYKGASVGIRKATKDVTTASVETKLKMHKTSANAMKMFYNKHWKNRYPALLTSIIFLAIDTITLYRTFRVRLSVKNEPKTSQKL